MVSINSYQYNNYYQQQQTGNNSQNTENQQQTGNTEESQQGKKPKGKKGNKPKSPYADQLSALGLTPQGSAQADWAAIQAKLAELKAEKNEENQSIAVNMPDQNGQLLNTMLQQAQQGLQSSSIGLTGSSLNLLG